MNKGWCNGHTTPDYYDWHPADIECIDVIEWFNFNIGSAIKYLWRHGRKGEGLGDLKKARVYIEREIKRLEKKGEKERDSVTE